MLYDKGRLQLFVFLCTAIVNCIVSYCIIMCPIVSIWY